MQGRKEQSGWACGGGIQLVEGASSFRVPGSNRAGPSGPAVRLHTRPSSLHRDQDWVLSPTSSWRIMPGQAAQKRQGQTAQKRQGLPKHNSQLRTRPQSASAQQKYVGVCLHECVRMCMCVCACACVCMHVHCAYACVHEHACMCVARVRAHACMCMCVCMCACACMRVHARVRGCVCACVVCFMRIREHASLCTRARMCHVPARAHPRADAHACMRMCVCMSE